MTPTLSVVLCSLNGAAGVGKCLGGLQRQTIADELQVIVVDDGSEDDTAAVAASYGATVIRHPQNRGQSAARNTGLARCEADVVAFLDDDCVPAADWAVEILAGYTQASTIGVGGLLEVVADPGPIGDYLKRHNPIRPAIAGAQTSIGSTHRGEAEVWALVGANMSFRRSHLESVDGFDEHFRFGADDMDIAHRLHQSYPDGCFLVRSAAVVSHEFTATLSDVMRRGRGYGRGAARLHRKHGLRIPKIFWRPVAVGLTLALIPRVRSLGLAACLLPAVMMPQSLQAARRRRDLAPLLDGYIRTLQEAAQTRGYLEAWREYADFDWERAPIVTAPSIVVHEAGEM